MKIIKKIKTNKFNNIFKDDENLVKTLENFKEKGLYLDIINLFIQEKKYNFIRCTKESFKTPLLYIYLKNKSSLFDKTELNQDALLSFYNMKLEEIDKNNIRITNQEFLNKNKDNIIFNKSFGCVFGLICGDALGATLEFEMRKPNNPILKDIIGGGVHNLVAGQWTDDTSMMLCLMESITNDKFNLKSQIYKYLLWKNKGYLSSKENNCFDIGITTLKALEYFQHHGEFLDTKKLINSGNGSIMRLAPIPIYYRNSLKDIIHYSEQSSLTTHQSPICLDACKLLGCIIYLCLNNVYNNKKDILFSKEIQDIEFYTDEFKNLITFDFLNLKYNDIPNTGYSLSTMISAIWCFYHTETLEDAIIKSVNLYGDSDTIGAVCGQIAGSYYGFLDIPDRWINVLYDYDNIFDKTKKLFLLT